MEEQEKLKGAQLSAHHIVTDNMAERVQRTLTFKQAFWLGAGLAVVVCLSTWASTNYHNWHVGSVFHGGHSVKELIEQACDGCRSADRATINGLIAEKGAWQTRAIKAEDTLENKAWLDENWQIALGLIHDNSLCLERSKIRNSLEFRDWNPALRGGFIDTAVDAGKMEVLQWITWQADWEKAAGIKAQGIKEKLGSEMLTSDIIKGQGGQ